jgi:6-phospho-3-hexuloisomerase
MFKNKIDVIIAEVVDVLDRVEKAHVEELISEISRAKKIVVCGAGRVGYAIRGFGMRLGHLGLSVYAVGDTTLPATTSGDLLIVASGSGETQTIFDLVEISKKNGCRIASVTGSYDSRIARISDCIVIVPAPSKTKSVNGRKSVQPMTTLNEQCLSLFFDSVVLLLMDKMNENHDSMWKRHSNLE